MEFLGAFLDAYFLIPGVFRKRRFFYRRLEEKAQTHHDGPHRNGSVCHIEGGPVMGAHIKIKEIYHFMKSYPINEVTQGPTQDEREAQGRPVAFTLHTIKPER
jgi:hypothetical protein